MNRAVYKTVTWYAPSAEDAKLCADCQAGWALTYNEILGVYVHQPNAKTQVTVCRSLNELSKMGHRWRLLSKEPV